MAGSIKGLFNRKWSALKKGKPWEAVKSEAKAWERRGDKLSGKANADAILAAQQESEGPVVPMADEEEIKRNKRRGAAARGGGRASTILSQGDSDRLGG